MVFICRYDVGVLTNCGPDIDKLCAEAKTKLRGTASVLKCLVEKFSDTQDNCQNEMSRAVRFALWDYSEDAPLTAVCDADVKNVCPKVSCFIGCSTQATGIQVDKQALLHVEELLCTLLCRRCTVAPLKSV
jgi:hypothetical protein